MTQAPSISVVMPSYRQAAYLEPAIRSVLDQDFPQRELIIVDGGSDDGSVEIISRHEADLTWWCSEPDDGQTAAINKGFRRATGAIVGWLNSDDLLLPGALTRIARAFADPGVQAVCGWGLMLDETGRVRRKKVFPQPTREVLLRRSLVFQPSFYWRRELLTTIGELDPSYHVCMDFEYVTRVVRGGIVPKMVPHFLAGFRCHSEQKTRTMTGEGEREIAALMRAVHGPEAAEDGRQRLPLGWRVRARVTELLLEKLGMYVGPWRRGTRVAEEAAE